MGQDEKGYIVIETTIAFLGYVLAVMSILTLANVTVVQSRVHFAITQACQSVAMYSYVLEACGAAEHMVNMASKAEGAEENVGEVVSNLNEIIKGASSLDGGAALDGVSNLSSAAGDMSGVDLLNAFLQKAEDGAFAVCMASLTKHYLANDYGDGRVAGQSGEEFLKAFGVEDGLSPSSFWGVYNFGFHDMEITVQAGEDGSRWLNGDGDVTVTVQYDVAYRFGGLRLPFEVLHIRQMVKTKAWLGGEGDGYEG